MFVLTKAAVLKCAHGGIVATKNSQDWVRIEGDPLLVDDDPLHRSIGGCPMLTLTTPPCRTTVAVDEASYSAFVHIGGRRLCLDGTKGTTDWSQMGTTPFSVALVAQKFVQCGG